PARRLEASGAAPGGARPRAPRAAGARGRMGPLRTRAAGAAADGPESAAPPASGDGAPAAADAGPPGDGAAAGDDRADRPAQAHRCVLQRLRDEHVARVGQLGDPAGAGAVGLPDPGAAPPGLLWGAP